MFTIGEEPIYGHKAIIEDNQHILIAGKSGVGKSTLLERYALSVIEDGHGITIIDPHGDLVDAIAGNIPPNRLRDSLYWHPFSVKAISLDPLSGSDRKGTAIDAVSRIVMSIFGDSWGAQTEELIKFVLSAVWEAEPERTVLHGSRFFLDKEFRKRVEQRLGDTFTKLFFEYFNRWPERTEIDKIAPPENKLSMFVWDEALRPVMWNRGRLDFRSAMDENKILLFNLASGLLGSLNARFLGAVILHKLAQGFMSRQDGGARNNHYVIVDEFLSFMGAVDPGVLLRESRKYGGRAVFCTQTLAGAKPQLISDLLGNTRTQICFEVSATDAEIMEHAFDGKIPKETITNLNDFEFYLRTKRDHTTQRVQKFRTLGPIPRNPHMVQKVKQYTEENHGYLRAKALAEIDEFLGHSLEGKN